MHGRQRATVPFLMLVAMTSMSVAQPPSVIPAGRLELARLVDLATDRLQINIDYDESILKGTATLRLDASVSEESRARPA